MVAGCDRLADGGASSSAECELAERLHWLEVKFDPSPDDLGWAELSQHERLYYHAVVRDLARYSDLWELIRRG